jgi:serine phosphatase RsbU (regulator of sigma subunit)
MVGRPDQPGAGLMERGLDALADSGVGLGRAGTLTEALQAIADAVRRAAGADAVVARAADESGGSLNALGVATRSPSLSAELEGSRLPLADAPEAEESSRERLPDAVRRAAERTRADHAALFPVHVDGALRGTLELLRTGPPFSELELRLARLGAAQAALAIRAFGRNGAGAHALDSRAALSVAGEALAAGADESRTADELTRLAAEATGAHAALLWRTEPDRPLELIASTGLGDIAGTVSAARAAAEAAVGGRSGVLVAELEGGPADEAAVAATLQLGQPQVGALQLLFPPENEPSGVKLATLATFGVRAAHALRASLRARTTALELERTQALLAVVGQAISQLSLAHTLDTAVAHVAELLEADRLAIYLREDGRLHEAAAVGLAGPHVAVAERLLELALGPFRSRGLVLASDLGSDLRLTGVSTAAAEAGIGAAIALPLLAQNEVVGLLAVFPPTGFAPTESDATLLAALAAQLAVAVQNARLHEQAKHLGAERKRALDAELAASKQVRALYEISRSFAQSLSLQATLDAVAATVVDVLDVDVALIGMPDERREWLVPRTLKVAEPRLEEAVRSLLFLAHPFGAQPLQRLFRLRESLPVSPATAQAIGAPATALLPFLERGWTGAVVPIATSAEVLAALTIISVRPGSPVTAQKIEEATAIAGQAALAIDNARLYQQQKQFADTMQRSLLPRTVPTLKGLELGAAYESSARVEVGGDVYDYMELADGRLAVALGDVTGHGIEAAADMAMAKFVFRTLAREHPEPADFLQSANEVVFTEIAPGKFITMVYLLVGGTGDLAAAVAGHPAPRLVAADGTVTGLEAGGLVLGIEPGQRYDEVRAHLDAGAAVVLYTDGVLEARREGELYGFERLDGALAAHHDRPAAEIAQAVLEDCRTFARGELVDDCAVVVVKRTA